MQRYGASEEAWDHFAGKLGLVEDLLPVVSNPSAEISDQSKMKATGKTPSIYNRAGKVAGLKDWTDVVATPHNIQMWKLQPDYGICIQTRKVRAFDLDTSQAVEIADAIFAAIGRTLPIRVRGERMLIAFTYNRPLTKHVIPVEEGIVEVLADGQQFVAVGTHPSGELYRWVPELPNVIPVLTGDEFAKVILMLETMFATGETRIARERKKGTFDGEASSFDDHVAGWLLEHWEVYDQGDAGQLFIDCPFADDHTTDSGPTSTAYFPAGTGGYAQGHFVCLHAHCVGRSDSDFRDATGYSVGQFEDLGPIDAGPSTPRPEDGGVHVVAGRAAPVIAATGDFPTMVRDGQSRIEPTAFNMHRSIQHGAMIGRYIAYDAFTDNLMWVPQGTDLTCNPKWKRFTDADMVYVRMELEQRGYKPMSKDLLRECVHSAGHENRIDTAVDWLNGLRWDGQSRVERFAVDCWGWKASEYSSAVSRYVWSAMAGRILQPGVRADMAPILVGAQGIRKTSAIQAMVPHEDMYAEIKLDDRDDDISRKLRGKLVGELEELRGLNSRAIEEIKAFVSRRRESWVPKFKEFENFFWRRNLLIGSTNDNQFLADPTGERRWLPGECSLLDVERIVENRDQLWAEGAVLFTMDGVLWQDAERLAEQEHPRFKIGDTWEHVLADWLDEEQIGGKTTIQLKGYVTAGEALVRLGIPLHQQDRRQELRVAKALKHLGLKEINVTAGDRTYKGYERA